MILVGHYSRRTLSSSPPQLTLHRIIALLSAAPLCYTSSAAFGSVLYLVSPNRESLKDVNVCVLSVCTVQTSAELRGMSLPHILSNS